MPIFNPQQGATITFPKSGTATPTTVPGATSSTALLTANTNRLGATIYNNSTARLYVEFGATASLTVFAVMVEPNGYLEVPFDYTGQITGIWAIANGSALVREFT